MRENGLLFVCLEKATSHNLCCRKRHEGLHKSHLQFYHTRWTCFAIYEKCWQPCHGNLVFFLLHSCSKVPITSCPRKFWQHVAEFKSEPQGGFMQLSFCSMANISMLRPQALECKLQKLFEIWKVPYFRPFWCQFTESGGP